jgi:hypothetical protein
MPSSLAIGSALPPAVDAFMKQALAHGAAPIPLFKLNTEVPVAAPYVVDNGGMFTLTVYPGPSLQFSVAPKLGRHVDASA